MSNSRRKTILEYIWIGGKNEIRSKTRVLNRSILINPTIENIPVWNYDGSSTWQANHNEDTEIILKPCVIYKDNLRNISYSDCYLVLCDTYNSKGDPLKNNYRYLANLIFEKNNTEYEPWFGLEQEYFIFYDSYFNKNNQMNEHNIKEGYHYCGKSDNKIERLITEEHLKICVETGLNISGINSEVSKGQWEFQIGPSLGINASDELIIARYLLEKIAEKYNATICFEPKPFYDINGSGCHINFSTIDSRGYNGMNYLLDFIKKLENKHFEDIVKYGENNKLRLTGIHETSSYDEFSYGIGTRNTSIRIPNQVNKDNCGYLEDRRPAANIDPYLATKTIFISCCLD